MNKENPVTYLNPLNKKINARGWTAPGRGGDGLIDICADFVMYNAGQNTLTVLNDHGTPVTFTADTFEFDAIHELGEGENFLFKADAWLAKQHGFNDD